MELGYRGWSGKEMKVGDLVWDDHYEYGIVTFLDDDDLIIHINGLGNYTFDAQAVEWWQVINESG